LIHAAPEKKFHVACSKLNTLPSRGPSVPPSLGGHFSADLRAQAAERFVYAFTVRASMSRGTALAHNLTGRNLKSGSRES
jgi:hypothetical protein